MVSLYFWCSAESFELCSIFHARSNKNLVFERFDLFIIVSSDTILIFHSGLGIENTVSQRIQIIKHKIGKINGAVMEVANLYNQMNNE